MTGIGVGVPSPRSGSDGVFEPARAILALLPRKPYLLGLVAICELLQVHVCQAQPSQVDFAGVKIAVESRSPVGAGGVAIEFGGEKFFTTEDQAGRSVALRLVRKPEPFKESQTLLPAIVSAALKVRDSQILTEVVEQSLSTEIARPLGLEGRWDQLVETPLGRQILTEAVSRRAGQYSEGMCLASLALSRQGHPVTLSEQVSSACLTNTIDHILNDRVSIASDNRVQEAIRAFRSADPRTVESADSLARSLRQLQEAKTVESYLAARRELSRGLAERGGSYDSVVVLSSFDDTFLDQAISSRAFSQVLTLVPHVSFDRRTQRTHEAILRALQAVGVDDIDLLRENGVLERLFQVAERDTEIDGAFERYLDLAITTLAQRGDAQFAIDLLHRIKRHAEPISPGLELSVLSAISSFLGRGELENATRLRDAWGGKLPMSLKIRWWLISARVTLWIALIGVIAFSAFILRPGRARSDVAPEGQAGTSPRAWPVGYEEAMRQVGLAPGVSLAEIKHAYRTAIKREHPDLNPQASAEQHAKFRELVASFERLIELHQRIH